MNDERDVAGLPGRQILSMVLALILTGAAVSVLFVLKKPAAIDVGVRFTPGQTMRYHMTMDVSGVTLSGTAPLPADDEIQADITWSVVSVNAKGTATVVQSVTDPTMSSNGHPVTLADLPSTTITIGADGALRTSNGVNLFSGGAPGPAQAGIARSLAFLPGYPVRPGDTWFTQVSQSFWGSALSYRATTTFLRREQLGSADAAVLESDATVPVDLTVNVSDFAGVIALPAALIPKNSTASYVGSLGGTTTTSWIDPSDGSLLKTVSRGNFSMRLTLKGFPKSVLNGDGTGSISGVLSMQLVRL